MPRSRYSDNNYIFIIGIYNFVGHFRLFYTTSEKIAHCRKTL